MKKEFYLSLKDILMSVEGIHGVKLWNSGIMDNLDTLNRFPLVFLQFAGLDYETISGNIQECNGARITTHILYKTLDGEDTGIFDISQAVFSAMQRAGFSRISEIPVYSGGEVINWQITFDAPRFTDEISGNQTTKHPKPPVVLG